MKRIASLRLFLAVLGISTLARAECIGPETPCEAFAKADHVFVGTVLESTPTEIINGRPFLVHVRMHVERAFKGFQNKEGQEIEFEQLLDRTLIKPEPGKRLLVFTSEDRFNHPNPSGVLESCQGTREVDTGYGYELGHMEALSRGRGPWALAGFVRDEAVPAKGVPDAVFRLEGPQQLEGRTGANGTFLLPELPSGSYSIRVSHPDYYWNPEWDKSVEIDSGGCAYVGFALPPNNFVQGRLLDGGGKPVASAFVFLRGLPAVWGDYPPGSRVRSSEDGTFVFRGIRPGPYFIELPNIGTLIQSRATASEAGTDVRAYYPGSLEASRAATIQVDRYSKVYLGDFRLPTVP